MNGLIGQGREEERGIAWVGEKEGELWNREKMERMRRELRMIVGRCGRLDFGLGRDKGWMMES
jgi:hypothetical protein